MDKYTIISNNCQTIYLYKLVDREYDNPFIGSYFQSDRQFLKFCQNYSYYISLEPEFKEPILPFHSNGPIRPGSYPTMFIGDIEVSWIHETTKEECIEKYKRRLERGKDKIPFFILGDSLLHQYHEDQDRENIICEFSKIPNSLYIRKEMSPTWKDCKHTDRGWCDGFAHPTHWIQPDTINRIVVDYFTK